MRNPQSATRSMGVVETSPSVPRRDGEGAFKDEELALIALNGPRLGGSTHGYTSWVAPAAYGASCACVTEAGWDIADAGWDTYHVH
jgi:hypothetical protein